MSRLRRCVPLPRAGLERSSAAGADRCLRAVWTALSRARMRLRPVLPFQGSGVLVPRCCPSVLSSPSCSPAPPLRCRTTTMTTLGTMTAAETTMTTTPGGRDPARGLSELFLTQQVDGVPVSRRIASTRPGDRSGTPFRSSLPSREWEPPTWPGMFNELVNEGPSSALSRRSPQLLEPRRGASTADDLAFFEMLLDVLRSYPGVNPDRLFAVGGSNGAGMVGASRWRSPCETLPPSRRPSRRDTSPPRHAQPLGHADPWGCR